MLYEQRALALRQRTHKAVVARTSDIPSSVQRARGGVSHPAPRPAPLSPSLLRFPSLSKHPDLLGVSHYLLYQAAELGARHPLLLLIASAPATAPATATVPTATVATVAAPLASAVTKTTAEAATRARSVSHLQQRTLAELPLSASSNADESVRQNAYQLQQSDHSNNGSRP